MKLKIMFLTFMHLSVCSSGRHVPTVPNILEMQTMQERVEQERISQERKDRQEENAKEILKILNRNGHDQNCFSNLDLNKIIAEGLAREIEIHNLGDNLYSRDKVRDYLRFMVKNRTT
jgi:hypothetical protein